MKYVISVAMGANLALSCPCTLEVYTVLMFVYVWILFVVYNECACTAISSSERYLKLVNCHNYSLTRVVPP